MIEVLTMNIFFFYSGADAFPAECSALMEQLVQGKMLQALVVGHEADGVPHIQLYDIQGDQVPAAIIFIHASLSHTVKPLVFAAINVCVSGKNTSLVRFRFAD